MAIESLGLADEIKKEISDLLDKYDVPLFAVNISCINPSRIILEEPSTHYPPLEIVVITSKKALNRISEAEKKEIDNNITAVDFMSNTSLDHIVRYYLGGTGRDGSRPDGDGFRSESLTFEREKYTLRIISIADSERHSPAR